jgi:hypothetical protein
VADPPEGDDESHGRVKEDEIIDFLARFCQEMRDQSSVKEDEVLIDLRKKIQELKVRFKDRSLSEVRRRVRDEILDACEEWAESNLQGVRMLLQYCSIETSARGTVWSFISNLFPEVRDEIGTQQVKNNEQVFIDTSSSESEDEGDIPPRRRMNAKLPVGRQESSPSKLMLKYRTLRDGRESVVTHPINLDAENRRTPPSKQFSFEPNSVASETREERQSTPGLEPRDGNAEEDDAFMKARRFLRLIEEIDNLETRQEAHLAFSRVLAEQVYAADCGSNVQAKKQATTHESSLKRKEPYMEEEPSRSSKRTRNLANI